MLTSHMRDVLKHQQLANKGSKLDKLPKTQRVFPKQHKKRLKYNYNLSYKSKFLLNIT